MPRHSLPAALLALASLVLPGCGGGEEGFHFTVHPAGGQVLHKGKPVPRAIVRFHPVDQAAVAMPEGEHGPDVMLTTETDEDGTFQLSTYRADDGIPAGEYVVTVATGRLETDVENADGPRAIPPRRLSPSETIYRDPARSPLRGTVKPGTNHYVFKLD